MFFTLLISTLIIALLVSAVVVFIFSPSINTILKRIVGEDISSAWVRYLNFALLVVGTSSGVGIYNLEKYITPPVVGNGAEIRIIELTGDRWIFEIYRTIMGTLSGVTWALLIFFVFALIAYVLLPSRNSNRTTLQT